MSAVEAGALPHAKLPIWQITFAGYRDTFRNAIPFLIAVALPLCLSVVLEAAFDTFLVGVLDSRVKFLVRQVPQVLFDLVWLRWLLLGTAQSRPRLLPRPGRRVFPYLGYTLLLTLLFLPARLVPDFGIWIPLPDDSIYAVPATAFVLYFIGLYFCLRLSFAQTYIAIDSDGRLRQSWRLSRGNGLRLLAICTLMQIPILVIGTGASRSFDAFAPVLYAESFDPETLLYWLREALDQLRRYLYNGAIIAAFVLAFCRLTGWMSNRGELLERFD